MPTFDHSTMWGISAFERERATNSTLSTTLLGSTLQAELHALDRDARSDDALQVFAACVRVREPALVCLEHDRLVWPVTLFPREMLYHSPRRIAGSPDGSLARVRAIAVEAPLARPPGPWMNDRAARTDAYHPLVPALWQLALQGPTSELLREIGGTAAYRVLRDPAVENLPATGALGSAVERMRRESMALRHVARLPGMSLDRASRLLNALYLTSNLVVARAHPAARPQATRSLFRGRR